MKKIKIGIFGLRRGRALIHCIQVLDGEVVAVCDSNGARVQKAREVIGSDVPAFTDFEEFFKVEMDCVYLANYFTDHAKVAARFLEKGVHVLSECTSNVTMSDGVLLVRAAQKSRAQYMLAENYPFMLFNQEMKKVYEGGTLGKVLFAEGEYNHPFSPYDTDFIKSVRPFLGHWRHYLPATYYVTHSLAPLMYATGSVPKRVTAFPVYDPHGDEYASASYVGDRAAIITTLNDDGSVFRVTGCSEFGAHENSYRLACENGQIENVRGTDGKVMLRYNDWAIPEGREENNFYMPEYHGPHPEEVDSAGHGGGDFFVVETFFDCLRRGKPVPFDVYFSATMASVAILSHRSVMEGGKPYDIPDFHREEDLKKYENDTVSPFPDAVTGKASYPCCSHPDYHPSEVQLRKYREVLKRAPREKRDPGKVL